MPRYAKKYRKRKRRPRKDKIIKNPLGLPVSNVIKMRYTEAIVLDVGAVGVISKYAFSANGLHDPNISGTGHQPMFYDEMCMFYNHYCVSGAKVTVKAYSTDPVGSVPNLVGIMVNDDTTTPANFNEVIEQQRCKYTILNPSNPSKTVSNTFSAKKFFNLTDIKDNYDRVGSPQGMNPGEQAYFTIFALPMNSSTDTGAFNCLVTIEYIAHWSEPKDVEQS